MIKKTDFMHTLATWSELPYNLSTDISIVKPGLKLTIKLTTSMIKKKD